MIIDLKYIINYRGVFMANNRASVEKKRVNKLIGMKQSTWDRLKEIQDEEEDYPPRGVGRIIESLIEEKIKKTDV